MPFKIEWMLESCIKAEHWLVQPQGQIQFPVIMYWLSDWLEANIAAQLEALSTEGSCQSPAEMSFIVITLWSPFHTADAARMRCKNGMKSNKISEKLQPYLQHSDIC